MTTTTMKVIPVRQDLSVNRFELLDRFRYRPEKGWKWLQHLAFWFLAKLGCYAWDEKVTVQAVRIDTTKVMECLMAQQRGLITHYHFRGERVLIGAKDFSEMLGDQQLQQLIHFDVPYRIDNYRAGTHVIAGMKITVVPWMEGILVVPKEVLQ